MLIVAKMPNRDRFTKASDGSMDWRFCRGDNRSVGGCL